MKYTKKEIQAIAQAMQKDGGKFMKIIGLALTFADENNTIKILETWSEDVEKYYEFSKSDEEQKTEAPKWKGGFLRDGVWHVIEPDGTIV